MNWGMLRYFQSWIYERATTKFGCMNVIFTRPLFRLMMGTTNLLSCLLGHSLKRSKGSLVSWASPVIIESLCIIIPWLLPHLLSFLKRNLSIGILWLLLPLSPLKRCCPELPVLSLPDFNKDFGVETDASKTEIRGVLMQDGHPIAYFSKKIGPHMQSASTYVRELFAVTETIAKWWQYLLGMPFVLRTDHKSLKDLLTLCKSFRLLWSGTIVFFEKIIGVPTHDEIQAGHWKFSSWFIV